MEVMDYPPDWTETIYGHYHHHWYTHTISHIITVIGTISDESCIRIYYVMQVASHTWSQPLCVEEGKGVRLPLALLSTICTPLLTLTGWSLGIRDEHLLESAKRFKAFKAQGAGEGMHPPVGGVSIFEEVKVRLHFYRMCKSRLVKRGALA